MLLQLVVIEPSSDKYPAFRLNRAVCLALAATDLGEQRLLIGRVFYIRGERVGSVVLERVETVALLVRVVVDDVVVVSGNTITVVIPSGAEAFAASVSCALAASLPSSSASSASDSPASASLITAEVASSGRCTGGVGIADP
jgi:hypothetical protein